MTQASVLRARGLRKEFPGQVALAGLDLDLHPGQVHALVGSNGSGKSTFIKMIAGAYPIDGGTLEVDGDEQHGMTPTRAYEQGLRFLHQRPAVFPALTVADNIGIASRFIDSSKGRLRPSAQVDNARRAMSSIGVVIDPRATVASLSPVERTFVSVAAALQRPDGAPAPRVLVLDEPTAALPEHEVELVFELVRSVSLTGIAVLYVSHRLPEVVELADVVTVLRDGVRVHHGRVDDLGHDDLVRHIVGEELAQEAGPPPAPTGSGATTVLDIEAVTTGRLRDVSLSFKRGEVVGIAGLLGSGRSELLRVLAGAQKPSAGRWTVSGQDVTPGSVRHAVRSGIAHVPEDRLACGIFPGLDASSNALLPDLGSVSRRGRLRPRAEARACEELMARHDVNPRDPRRPLGLFSGGNQQKLVIGRWLRLQPAVLLLDEPTQAVDVGAKAQIHAEIRQYAASGGVVVMVSSDFAELASVCQRVVVFKSGRVVRELSGVDLTEGGILHAASWDLDAGAPQRAAG